MILGRRSQMNSRNRCMPVRLITSRNRVSLKKRADVRITPARAEPRKSGPDFAIAGATDVDGLGVRLPRRDAFYQPARGIRRHAEIVVVAVLIGASGDLRRTGAWAPTSRRRADAVARKASRRTPRQYCSKGTADSGDLHHLRSVGPLGPLGRWSAKAPPVDCRRSFQIMSYKYCILLFPERRIE